MSGSQKSDLHAAAGHVAHVAAAFLSGSAGRAELEDAVADWRSKRDALGRATAFSTASGTVGGGGGTSLTQPEIPGLEPDTSPRRRRQRQQSGGTWLTPFANAWTNATGGLPPFGQMARAFKPLVELHGPDLVLERFKNYLAGTEARFVSPARFASTFGAWSTSAATRPQPRDPLDPLEGESFEAYALRTTSGHHHQGHA